MDRDTKLIAILRRQYHIILTALGENIFRIGRSREATEPNTEYISDIMYWRYLVRYETPIIAEQDAVIIDVICHRGNGQAL